MLYQFDSIFQMTKTTPQVAASDAAAIHMRAGEKTSSTTSAQFLEQNSVEPVSVRGSFLQVIDGKQPKVDTFLRRVGLRTFHRI